MYTHWSFRAFCWFTIGLVAAVLLLVNPPTTVQACSMMRFSLAELTEQSDLVVEGTIERVFADSYGADVQVAQVYKGEAPEKMTVNPEEEAEVDLLSGERAISSCFDLQASFREGEEVLLFLQWNAQKGWITTAMLQGKISRQQMPSFENDGSNEAPPQTWEELQDRITDLVGQPPSSPAPIVEQTPNTPLNIPLWAYFFGLAGLLTVIALAWNPLRNLAQKK